MERDQISFENAVKLYGKTVKQLAKFTLYSSKLALRPVLWATELPSQIRPNIADRIRATRPLHDARIGKAAIEAGQNHDDSDLALFGEAMVANAVHRAVTDRAVPSEVTDEVTEIAKEVQCDPEANPLVNDFIARRVQEAIGSDETDK